jgi:serine/threonine protein phosphatase PrpC
VSVQLADPVNGIAPFIVAQLTKSNVQDAQQIVQTIIDAHLEYDKKHFQTEYRTGSTSVMVILPPTGNDMYIAYVGDSRAAIYKDATTFVSTIDHKPSVKSERDRIARAGGHVTDGRCSRVNGILAVSRAFGDAALKHVRDMRETDMQVTQKTDTQVMQTTDLTETKLCTDDIHYKYDNENSPVSVRPSIVQCIVSSSITVIVACDGLWDVLNESTVGQHIQQADVCSFLVKKSINELCSGDNVSVMRLHCNIVKN